MKRNTTRREFLKDTALIGAAVGALRAADAAAAAEPAGKLPKIRIGKLEVSRLILGSNPFFGFSHGNPQASG
ncbi:MAG: twin-arginine translocation signal domain-containing protein, partial [Phycisphaerae bacterium]